MATPKKSATANKEPKYTGFSQRLKERSVVVKRTKGYIATTLKANTDLVNNWFNGFVLPSEKRIIRLAAILKTTPEWLLNGDTPAITATQSQATTDDTLDSSDVAENPVESLAESSKPTLKPKTKSKRGTKKTAVDPVSLSTAPKAINEADIKNPTEKPLAPVVDTKTKPRRPAKPKLSLKERIAQSEAQLKKLRIRAKAKKQAEHQALGELAMNFAEKDAVFAKMLLDSLRRSLASKPKQPNAKALTQIMNALERKVLEDEQAASA